MIRFWIVLFFETQNLMKFLRTPKYLSVGLALSGLSPNLFAQQATTQLDPLIVTGEVTTSEPQDEQDATERARERVASTPGGASVISPDDWTGRTLTTEQIFEFAPGVSARSRGLGSDARISVRGSGAQRQFGDRGLTLQLDGIPINDADGSFYFRTIDPLTTKHVEVFRGANGLIQGGSQLGGVINFVQKNGRNSPGVLLQSEYGTFDTFRAAFQYGDSTEKWDWFTAYTFDSTNGFRERTEAQTHFLNVNAGYKWSDTARTRIFLHHSDSNAALSGSLSPDEFDDDPTQAGSNRTDDADRDLATFRIGQRTEWITETGNYSFFANFQILDFDHLINEGLFRFNRLIDYETDEAQIGLTGEERYEAFGLEQSIRVYASGNFGRQDEQGFGGFVTPGNPAANFDRDNFAWNVQFFAEHDLQFAPKHHLILGAGFNHADRRSSLNSDDTTGDQEFDFSDTGLTYRAGYLYEFDEQSQIFANFSQSFEGSPFAESQAELNPQVARTFEIGARYQNNWLSGEVALFWSNIDDEFVDEEIALGVFNTTNLDTIHRGIEAGFSADLTSLVGSASPVRLSFDQKYQYNDFEIDGGVNDGNRLPGIAEQVINSRLRLQDNDANWQLAISANWLPDGLVVNNANTLQTDGFVSVRLAGELQIREGLALYGGIDNLFDEEFANNVTINPSGDQFIDPSAGRSFYGGLRYQW